ncbi:hypothetical protein BO94DRAFT_461712 [Aspergillus sclerotioniger CBS 115572]|uniref:Uncharacterized protein n=1 Tax=Aspergillus sclerotioniger CBS 115572 TaxID=1450535 RepID=A0A317WZM1_9EURO|nr:hypothetical protein BO94DRAFT_461712 [Aspergillus sclerotioniger CBS 115572]PWY91834.1 hypothetical protein BO94DRAFT_461712 [Aspergillus sclerotioniger CBS 115572]
MSSNPREAPSPRTAPPPPPPPLGSDRESTLLAAPRPPIVAGTGPAGAFMVQLLIYNGHPFKDHWAYWVCSHASPDYGVMIHATGDVRNGFKFEVKRGHDFRATQNPPSKRIPLQWVSGEYFDEGTILNNGQYKIDNDPVCGFEASAHKVKAPGKSLNTTDSKKVTQRNCQTWIVESADQLVRDNIFDKDVADYLHAIQQ